MNDNLRHNRANMDTPHTAPGLVAVVVYNGLSLFDAIGTVSAGHDVPTLPLAWPLAEARAGIIATTSSTTTSTINFGFIALFRLSW